MIKSTAKRIWNQISFDKNLVARFFYLNRTWFEFLRTVARYSGFVPEEGVRESPYEYLKWIKENLNVGSEDSKAGSKTHSNLYKFYNTVKYDTEKTGKDRISPKTLVEYGFDEKCYKDTLIKMSQYMAALSGLSIPEKITEYCKIKILDSPIEEKDIFGPYGRFPIIFIIDTSSSMSSSLSALHDGLKNLVGLLKNDEKLRQKTDLYIITTTGKKLMDFTSLHNSDLDPDSLSLLSTLSPARITEALNTSIADLEERIISGQTNGAPTDYCPWIILISNGKWLMKYNEDFDLTAQRVKEKTEEKEFKIYLRSLQEPGDMNEKQRDMMARLDPNFESLKNVNDFFKTVFQSLCKFMAAPSSSCGDGIELPNTNGI